MIADWSWTHIPQYVFWNGEFMESVMPGIPPKPFELFNWFIKPLPNYKSEMFNIPPKIVKKSWDNTWFGNKRL